MSTSPTLLVIGSGPGIGVSTAALFAQKRFERIALISRRSDRLAEDKATIATKVGSAKNVDITTWAVDITDSVEFKKTLHDIELWAQGNIECVLYNAARVNYSTLTSFTDDELLYDFKVSFTSLSSPSILTNDVQTTTVALHTAFTWALPLLKKHIHTSTTSTGHSSFLVTSSLLWRDPIPQMFSLCLTKAAQRNLVMSLYLTYPELHIVLLNVKGQVSVESAHWSPEMVAEKWWEVYSLPKEDWTVDVDMLESS